MTPLEKYEAINVLGDPLEPCGLNPITGFFRDGSCNSCQEDQGSHTVCVELTETFLQFSRFQGNDLSSPRPEFNFPGLKAGDRWCLCAIRWLQAYESGMAPNVYLEGTHAKALEVVSLELLVKHQASVN